MNEKRCKTCAFWEPNTVPDGFQGEYGIAYRCFRIPFYYDAVRIVGGEPVLESSMSDILAFATDVDEANAYLLTRPEFGCVHYDTKR